MKEHLHADTIALHELVKPPEGAKRTAHTERMHGMMEPVHDAIIHVQDKLREVRRALRQAKRNETHEQGTGFFERFAQTCEAAEREAAAALQHLDMLTLSVEQLDRYALEWQASNEHYLKRVAAEKAAAPVSEA